MKDVKKKGILLIITMILLFCVVLYVSFAWYTKMTGVGGMLFKAAKWDFNAQYQVSEFVVRVNEYTKETINPQLAAPGTEGYVATNIRAENADVGVQYVISIDKSTMGKNFQDRVFFYYVNDGDETGTKHEFVPNGTGKSVLTGTLEPNETKKIHIFWRWAYDYDEILQKNDKDAYDAVMVIKAMSDQDREFFLYDDASEARVLGGGENGKVLLGNNYISISPANRDLLNNYMAKQFETVSANFIGDEAKTPVNSFWKKVWMSDTNGATEEHLEYGTPSGTLSGDALNVMNFINGLKSSGTNAAGLTDFDVFFRYTDRVLGGENLFVGNDNAYEFFGLSTVQDGEEGRSDSEKLTTLKSSTGSTIKSYWNQYLSDYEAHDDFDTLAGTNTSLYERQMSATVIITGEQVVPEPVSGGSADTAS